MKTPEELQAKRLDIQQKLKQERHHPETRVFFEGWLVALHWIEEDQ